jgi:hypothetical protein
LILNDGAAKTFLERACTKMKEESDGQFLEAEVGEGYFPRTRASFSADFSSTTAPALYKPVQTPAFLEGHAVKFEADHLLPLDLESTSLSCPS